MAERAKSDLNDKAPHVTYTLASDNEEETIKEQKAWAKSVADGILRGEVPDDVRERRMLAEILLAAADQLKVSPRNPGNPAFTGKIDPVSADLLTEIGKTSEQIAELFDVDPRSVRRARKNAGRNSKK